MNNSASWLTLRMICLLQNAFWLRKLLFEASPKLLLEHGDKFEASVGL